MSRIYLLWLGLLATCAPGAHAQSASYAFFDDSIIQQISLTVNPTDWAILKANNGDASNMREHIAFKFYNLTG